MKYKICGHSSQAWRKIGGKDCYFRSIWEANYGRYLELLKQNGEISDWFHEPETFWFEEIKRGVRSYKPDFKVINLDESYYWVEVKGYFDSKSLTKIKRFKKYYPDQKLVVVSKIWFTKNNSKLRGLIRDWENGIQPQNRKTVGRKRIYKKRFCN